MPVVKRHHPCLHVPLPLASPPRRVKSGQGIGTIGQLTGSLITRTSYYEHVALMALVPLLNPGLYPGFAAPAPAAPGTAGQEASGGS